MWRIEDWAGNRKFPDKTFATFWDGWDFLASHFGDDIDSQLNEWYVVQD